MHELSQRIYKRDILSDKKSLVMYDEVDKIITDWLKEKASNIIKHNETWANIGKVSVVERILGIKEESLEEKLNSYYEETYESGTPARVDITNTCYDTARIAKQYFKDHKEELDDI